MTPAALAWARRRPAALLLAPAAAILAGAWWTRPPPMPAYAEARAAWTPSEAWLRDRHGRLLETARIDFAVRRLEWVPLPAIAPALRDAVIAAEDRRFRSHGGVDLVGLSGSLLRGLRGGARPRGASTLTMQLAGFLAPALGPAGTRSPVDKLRQMRAAWAIEARWSKEQILEAYLNLAAFRGETQGIGAAARALLGKAPDAIDADDAALLAALLPSPQADWPAIGRRACRLRGLAECDALMVRAAAMTGADRRLAGNPHLAPHLARRLLARPGQTVRSTVDARIQAIAIAALRRQLAGLGERARDGAVVVVDNATGDVLAYVGGIGGASTAADVDNADSLRQAGSTLKPFLYGHAIERGYLTAASTLDDSPLELDTASGLYVPRDYDHVFKGPVSVRQALAASLNVPAVRALLLDGVEDFRDRLWDVGYAGLTEAGDFYGFSLALGSAEVTLMQQAEAYLALADGGRRRALRLAMDAPAASPRAVMTPAAAWIVADILADADARAVTFGVDSALRLPFWAAAKTGTSKAMRDNWCAGFSDRFTVAVWIGNAEGDSMTRVSGTSGAAPVWREVMLALHRDRPGRQPPAPPGIVRRPIRYEGGVEQPRLEAFVAGTAQREITAAPASARRPRIAAPVAGTAFALDPDIPPARQRIRLAAHGAGPDDRLRLDDRLLGPATEGQMVPVLPGRHRVDLVDAAGRVADSVSFSVR